ncbi:MAG: SdpI family protein [Candidatus Micrarchaeota archaeon]|nr:SdpI family protein [Candidatus Micrarchaeota archaeon]
MHKEILPVLMLVLMFAIAVYADPLVHTNEKEEVTVTFGFDGRNTIFAHKSVILYLVPFMTLVLYVGFSIIPKIEIYQKNLENFYEQFLGFKILFVFIMCVIYISMLLPNLGYWRHVDTSLIIIFSVAILFFYVGYMLNFTKRNYFIGVRTPWTLADEKIWEKTNRLAAKLFWICGVFALVGLVVQGDLRLWLLIIPAIVSAIIAGLYSLYEYLKTKRQYEKRRKRKVILIF